MELKSHTSKSGFFGCTALAAPSDVMKFKVRLKPHIRRAKGFFMHTNLPHIDQTFHYQFITFRTKDSTDKFVKNLLSNKTVETKKLQYSIDKYLDNSLNGAKTKHTVTSHFSPSRSISKSNTFSQIHNFVLSRYSIV